MSLRRSYTSTAADAKTIFRLCLNRASALRARASMLRFDAITLALALFSRPQSTRGPAQTGTLRRGGRMSKKQRADHIGETRTAYLKNARRVIMAGEVCGICGRPVDKALRYPNPMAPSVDHIIPISRGGHPSDIDNLQLTHWCCNHAKSDRIMTPPAAWSGQGGHVCNRNLPQHVDWGRYGGDTTP